MRKRFKHTVRTLVSVAFFVVLFTLVRRGELVDHLQNVDVRYLVLSFLLIPVMVALSCWKWKVLLDHQGHRIRFGYLLRIYFIGYFFTNILPSTVGGDLVRSYYSGRHIGSQTHAAVAVFIERFTGLLLLLLLAIVAPLLKAGLYPSIAIVIPAGCALLILAVIVWVAFLKSPLALPDRVVRALLRAWRVLNQRLGWRWGDRLVARVDRHYDTLHGHSARFHERLMAAFRAIGADVGTLFIVLLLTVAFYLLTLVNVYFAFHTFRVDVDFLSVSSVVPTVLLTFLLPVSQGNLGLAEGAYVFYFSMFGVPVAATLAMALFMRFKLLCSGCIGYICYLRHKEFKIDIEKLSAAESPPLA